MRRRTLLLTIGAVALAPATASLALAPRSDDALRSLPQPVTGAEQDATIAALRPPKRAWPVIAILCEPAGTEVSDFLVAHGILASAGMADIVVVASQLGDVKLYPNLIVQAQMTFASFDDRFPEGADYVIVPALEPRDNPDVLAWLKSQHGGGATLVAICNGAKTIAAAGLLNGRRATAHWNDVVDLQERYPEMEYVPDRRYVVDDGVVTSTGVTSSMPLMMAIVEAVGGLQLALRVGRRLGVETWDAGHRSSDFVLSPEHMKTAMRNKLAFWRRETIVIDISDDVDEIALGLMVDAYSRTGLTDLAVRSLGGDDVRTVHGLTVRPDHSVPNAAFDLSLDVQKTTPGNTLDRELGRIAERYDGATAAFVALTMEYPWVG